MQNARGLASAQRDQLLPSSHQAAISMHRTNPGSGAFSAHKLNMGFTQVQAQKKKSTDWRICAQDEKIARGFARARRIARNFHDTDFLPINTGMRIWCPACNLIVSAVAANDMYHVEDIVEAVGKLGKDSCRKLNDTNNQSKIVVPNPLIPPGQVVVHLLLLPPGAPNQCGAASTIGNPGELPPNAPTAHLREGGQLRQGPSCAAG